MTSGFQNWKDVFDVVAIPIAVAVLALVWPAIESYYRRRRFQRIARRELALIAPFPEDASQDSWKQHVRKRCLHRLILEDVSPNRDFLLSLNPDFVYYLVQLWAAYDNNDAQQWLYFLDCLSRWGYSRSRRRAIADAAKKWESVIAAYEAQAVQNATALPSEP